MPSTTAAPRFQARVDVTPLVLEFLGGLRADDILTELVQNDLDQGASETHVRFTRDALIVEGNGRPVDTVGWSRLSYLLGAGGDVEAKRDGIGAKNHGLRSCFALGDEIVISSAERQTRLTLTSDPIRRRLHPGAWEHPIVDAEAPQTGARIVVAFRTKPLLRSTGEDTGIPVPHALDTERLFDGAAAQSPMRYIGCVRPGMMTRYVLTVEHWRRGTCVFTYSCGPLRKKGRLRGFRRRCDAVLADGRTESYEEEAVLFQPRNRVSIPRIPGYYRGRSGLLCEVSWRTGGRGQPVSHPGRLRYPIAYAADAANARTDLGASFSAPFVSDAARHGLAQGVQAQNAPLVRECEQALVRLLRDYLLPRYGVAGLSVLWDPEHPRSERATRLILEASACGALPAAPRSRAGRRRGAGGQDPRRSRVQFVPRSVAGKPTFIIPAYRGNAQHASTPLPELAPKAWAQIHPGIPEFIRATLLDQLRVVGEGLSYTSFDELDVAARLCRRTEGHFPWDSEDEWRRELEDPARARLYLDVLSHGQKAGSVTEVKVAEICRVAQLPDRYGQLQPWGALWRHRHEIPEIPGVQVPPCVHPLLTEHSILSRGKLAIKPFALSEYLVLLDFGAAGAGSRAKFFDWLVRNEKHVAADALEKLALQPIWPTTDGAQVPFAELCALEPGLRRVLAGNVRQPTPAVLSLRRVRTDGRGLLRLRTRPASVELRAWWDNSLRAFPTDRVLTEEERTAWDAHERALARFWADTRLRPEMPWLGPETLAIAGDGRLRPVSRLHARTPHVVACELLSEDLIEGAPAEFHVGLGALVRPSADAIVRALASNPEPALLYRRLAALADARKRGDALDVDISALSFINVNGDLHPPRSVALQSTRDYWGSWRIPLNADRVSAERQAHLRAVGVAGRVPDAHTSRQFFEWLSIQNESELREHLDQVVRHLLHEHGPLSWWQSYPGVPCLPAYSYGRQIRLISRREAFSGSNPVLLPDFAELERQVLARDRRRRIAIVETPGVSDSAFGRLKEEGLKSLRQIAAAPFDVRAESAGVHSESFAARLALVASDRFASDFRKRLQELHVDRGAIRHRWLYEVRLLKEVRVVPGLEAGFRVGTHEYWLRVEGASDAGRGILWISGDAASPTEAFFVALAERIFEPGSPSYLAFALQAAVSAGYVARFDNSMHQLGSLVDDADDVRPAPAEGKSTDVRKAHNPPKADLANRPEPAPIPPRPQLTHTDPVERRRRRRGGRPESPEERAAIDDLKEKHYAWHCQVCLAAAEPSLLAPQGSYACRAVHRRAFVAGHHVDPVQGQGVRWVSNVVILCEYHHRLVGDRLEHPALVTALGGGERRIIEFQDGDGSRTRVDGLVATVQLDAEPWTIALFYTLPHAAVWLG